MQTKIKIGDRVRYYGVTVTGTHVIEVDGTVEATQDDALRIVLDHGGSIILAHYRQCRVLKQPAALLERWAVIDRDGNYRASYPHRSDAVKFCANSSKVVHLREVRE